MILKNYAIIQRKADRTITFMRNVQTFLQMTGKVDIGTCREELSSSLYIFEASKTYEDCYKDFEQKLSLYAGE